MDRHGDCEELKNLSCELGAHPYKLCNENSTAIISSNNDLGCPAEASLRSVRLTKFSNNSYWWNVRIETNGSGVHPDCSYFDKPPSGEITETCQMGSQIYRFKLNVNLATPTLKITCKNVSSGSYGSDIAFTLTEY